MKKIVNFFQQTLMASTGVLFAIGVKGLFYYLQGNAAAFFLPWYTPFAIILSGGLCSLATLLLFPEKELSRVKMRLYLLLHFLTLLAIVSAVGRFAGWYSDLPGYLFVFVSYSVIYALVWIGSLWLARYEEKQINQVLGRIQDKE